MVELEGAWVTPGLIDCHTHLVFGGNRATEWEARLEGAIHLRFGLPPKNPLEIKTLIKKADRACAFFEATQLAGFGKTESLKLFGRPPAGLTLKLEPLSHSEAQALYLRRFEELARDG